MPRPKLLLPMLVVVPALVAGAVIAAWLTNIVFASIVSSQP
jgi:hypothetical protein